ncbi:MAG TPA: hypothetical protein PK340_04245 [Bacilli bacterium]|nr:hypothetical protein [Bacilli bacterium]
MKKGIKLLLGLSTLFGIGLAGVGFDITEPVATEAVSSTRLYIVVNQSIKDRAPAYKLYTGSADVNLSLMSTIDSRHTGDVFTYYTDATITNWMTFKNNGGESINLYNISNVGCKSTWDTITFTGTISNWNAAATYSTSVYTPPVVGETYDVSLYNGVTLIGTQTAYEDVTFTPSNITVTDHTFHGWYTDSSLTTPYTPTVLTGATSLYGDYRPIDLNRSIRIYIESTNSWWYDASARIDIFYWKSGVTASVQTMRKEVGNLHSVVLENATFTHIKLERKNPSTGDLWNSTGDIPVNLLAHNVVKFSGPLNNGYTGAFTVTDFANTAPDVAYLKTQVPLLTCSNYSEADTLLGAYNRLGDNELEIIDALTVKSFDDQDLGYKLVIDYYVGWKAANATPPGLLNVVARSDDDNSMLLITIGALAISMFGYFIILRKRKIA